MLGICRREVVLIAGLHFLVREPRLVYVDELRQRRPKSILVQLAPSQLLAHHPNLVHLNEMLLLQLR